MSAKEKPSLYERIGGAAAVEAVVSGFYDRVLADETLARYFKSKRMPDLKKKQVEFFTQILGGGQVYSGLSMKEAHARLSITPEQFGRVAGHLKATLEAAGVEKSMVDEVMAAAGGLAGDIVGGKKNVNTEAKMSESATIARDLGLNQDKAGELLSELSGLRGIIDSLETNVFVASTDLYIVYINPRALQTLKKLPGPSSRRLACVSRIS